MNIVLRAGLLSLLAAASLLADVSYTKALSYTGGSMVGFLRNMVNSPLIQRMVGGDFGAALDDQSYTVYVKGSKMAQVTDSGATIYDLDARTVTLVNNEKQSYSVETFDELRAQIERAEQWMKPGMKHDSSGAVRFDVGIERTDQTRSIDGRIATKALITLTSQSESTWGKPVVNVTSWLVPVDPGMRTLYDFSRRAAQELSSVFTLVPSFFGAAGTSVATTDTQKLKGISVLDRIAVTGVTTPLSGLLGNRSEQENAPVVVLRIESSGFSYAPLDSSRFAIPAGYRQEARRQ